jgi:archaemetzincin
MPADGLVIMAITSQDLYAEGYNFLFGQARAKHRVAVSSIHRYYEPPLDNSNRTIVLQRLIKTSSHEISHMFSLQHCINAVCVMNGSNSLSESDRRPNRLCSECLKKLEWNLGFDVKGRLEGLEDFFVVNGMERDGELVRRDLRAVDE